MLKLDFFVKCYQFLFYGPQNFELANSLHFAVSHIVLKGAFSIFPYLPMESRELKWW